MDASNPLCHKASQSPNIDKDKYFHSVNSSQYDSIRTENSSKNGSIHNPTDYQVQSTKRCKNSVPYLVPSTAPYTASPKGAEKVP